LPADDAACAMPASSLVTAVQTPSWASLDSAAALVTDLSRAAVSLETCCLIESDSRVSSVAMRVSPSAYFWMKERSVESILLEPDCCRALMASVLLLYQSTQVSNANCVSGELPLCDLPQVSQEVRLKRGPVRLEEFL